MLVSETKVDKKVKLGIVFSYVLIILNALYSIIVIPFIIRSIGSVQYGTYKTIASLSNSILVLDFGLGGTLIRFIANFRNKDDFKQIRKLIKITFLESFLLAIFISVICFILYTNIGTIYKNGLDVEEIQMAKRLFGFLAINLVLHLFESNLYGIISGYNYFNVSNGMKLLRIVMRIVLTFVFLSIYKNPLVLVVLDLFLTIILIVFESLFIILKLKIGFHLSEKIWDKHLFLSTFKYSILIFATTIAAQINSNLDNVFVGAFLGANSVAIYSIGLVFFAMFENLSTAISGAALPTITNSLARDPSGKEAEQIIIDFGRIQFILLGAALAGFIVVGKDFIALWVGDGFEDAYYISLILMIPSIFELSINVCLSVLRAKNKLGFRTAVISIFTIINMLITFFGVKYCGYYWAAIGTGVSFLFGSVVVMGIYYYKKLAINILFLYKKIFNKIFLCIIFSTIILIGTSRLLDHGWQSFLLNVLVFCVAYFLSLYFFGFTDKEKSFLRRLKK